MFPIRNQFCSLFCFRFQEDENSYDVEKIITDQYVFSFNEKNEKGILSVERRKLWVSNCSVADIAEKLNHMTWR